MRRLTGWQKGLGVALVVVVVAALGYWRGGILPHENYRNATPDEMYQSIGDFYSAMFDRSDVANGKFVLWPKAGDRVRFRAVIDSVSVDAKTHRGKDISKLNDVVTIETTTTYFLKMKLSPVYVDVRMQSKELGKEISVHFPISIQIDEQISAQTADEFRKLQLVTGQTVEVVGIISNYEYFTPGFPGVLDAAFRFSPSLKAGVYHGRNLGLYNGGWHLSLVNNPVPYNTVVAEIARTEAAQESNCKLVLSSHKEGTRFTSSDEMHGYNYCRYQRYEDGYDVAKEFVDLLYKNGVVIGISPVEVVGVKL